MKGGGENIIDGLFNKEFPNYFHPDPGFDFAADHRGRRVSRARAEGVSSAKESVVRVLHNDNP